MSSPPSRRTDLRSLRLVELFLAATLMAACSGNGCSCGGFQQGTFPAKHYDKTLPRSGQLRVTKSGLNFFEQNIPTILKQVRPGGLNFCIAKQKNSNVDICTVGKCNNGKPGCQMELALKNADIKPKPKQDQLNVAVQIGKLNEKIPFDPKGLGISAECRADLHKSGAGKDVPATVTAIVPVEFIENKQSPTNDVSIHVGQVQAKLKKLAFELEGRGDIGDDLACGGLDLVKGLAEDQIKQRMKDQVNSAVQDAVRGQLCRTCGKSAPSCPSKSTCEKVGGGTFCQWKNKDRCVPRELGTEGRLVLQDALGEFMEPDKAEVHLMAKAADMADVDQSGGVNLGLRNGFQPTQVGDCIPVERSKRPSFGAIPRSPAILTNTQPGTGDKFHVGIGIHRRTLEQMFWSVWGSEGLCMKIGSDFNELLSTGGLGVFLDSLGTLADREGPVFMRVTPQTPPDVTLGKNRIEKTNGSYSLKDPLLTIDWKNLDMHFYAFVQDRFTRLFTTRLDLKIPIGLTSTDGKLKPVTGDLGKAPRNVRVRNNEILADKPSKLRDLIPTLLNAALPQLTGSLSQPIDLPSFFGLKLVFKQEDITSVRGGKFLALYGKLAPAKTMQTNETLLARPTILETSVDTTPRTATGIPRPTARVELGATGLGRPLPSGAEVEYSYRLDGGNWSLYTSRRQLTIDDPALALPGRHTLEVRARPAGRTGAASEPVETTLTVDYEPPRLSIEREGTEVHFEADDTVDPADRLRYRYRLGEAGSWSRWSSSDTFDLSRLDRNRPVTLTVQVRDASGRVAETSARLDPAAARADETAAQPSTSAPTAGCASSGDDHPADPLGLLLLLLPAGWLVRRRRSLLLALAAALLLALGGCSESGQKNRFQCKTADDCSCAGGKTAACLNGQCACKNFCKEGCGDREYCCYQKDQCQSLPNPCEGKSCKPGYEPKITDKGDIDRSACSVSGAKCACKEMPPIDLRWYGKHTSLDAGAGVVAVSTYNRHFGDLMVGVLNDSLEPTWYTPAGVPDDGTLAGAPSGPRGGFEEAGPNVGTHSAIAVDGSGRLHVVYRSLESGEEGLYYLRGTQSDSGWNFSTPVEVDTDGNTGFYTSAAVADGTFYASWGVRSVQTENDGQQTQVRHIALPVDAAVDSLSPKPTVAYSSDPVNPCGSGCSGNKVCFARDGTCAKPVDACNSCSSGKKCRASKPKNGGKPSGTCETVYTPPSTPSHRLMTGLYTETLANSSTRAIVFYDRVEERVGVLRPKSKNGWKKPQFIGDTGESGPYASGVLESSKLHLAYMNPDRKVLRYLSPDAGSPESIVGGIRDRKKEYLHAQIGHDVELWLGSNGSPRVLFQDATTHTLHVARRSSEGWKRAQIGATGAGDNYVGERGFYAGAVETGSGLVAADMVIDQQADQPSAHLKFQPIQ